MKKLTTAIIGAGLLTSFVIASPVIEATKVGGDLSNGLKSAKFTEVTLYPQTTIRFNDKKVNMGVEKAKKAEVAVLYNDKEISLVLKWADETESQQKPNMSDSYGDAFAVQFPENTGSGADLPYIGMGDVNRPVVVYLQKNVEKFFEPNGEGDVKAQTHVANQNVFGKDAVQFARDNDANGSTDYQKAFVAKGFRSLTQIRDTDKFSMEMTREGKGWQGQLVRPLKDDYLNLSADVIPVSLAVWDGEKSGRNGAKWLSAWVPVKFKDSPEAKKVVDEVNWSPNGDLKNGEKIAAENCTACHNFGESKIAPQFMAPDLSNIGGYANASYLKESILEPSKVVVPGYNRNAHKNFEWYTVDGNGTRTSTMPPYGHLQPKEVDDVITYLQTLKVGVK